MDQQTNEPMMPSGGKKPVGPVIGVIIIVLILILGGLYFWGEKLNNTYTAPAQPTTTTAPADTSDAQTDKLNQQSTSDNLSAIDADLKNTDTTNLSAGVNDTGL